MRAVNGFMRPSGTEEIGKLVISNKDESFMRIYGSIAVAG
jgi:hypothetical protein